MQKPAEPVERGRAYTLRGARKPGSTSSGRLSEDQTNLNLGGDMDNQKNPFTMLINQARRQFKG